MSLRFSLLVILCVIGQDFKLGAIIGLSGANAYYGELIKRGCELAREEIGDQKVHLMFEDSQSNANEGIKAYKNLLAKGANGILTAMSIVSVPISSLANNDKRLQFAVLSWANSYSSPDDYTFRLDIRSNDATQQFCEYLRHIDAKDWAILAVKTVWGTDTKNLLLNSCGDRFSFVEDYLEQERDLNQIILKFKNKSKGVLIVEHRIVTLAEWVKRLRELKYTGEILYGGGIAQDETLFRVAGDKAHGMKFLYVILDEKKIQDLHKNRYGQEAINPYLVALGYESTKVMYHAFKNCIFKDHDCPKNFLFSNEFDTVFGKIGFDKNGDATGLKTELRVVENGKFVTYEYK